MLFASRCIIILNSHRRHAILLFGIGRRGLLNCIIVCAPPTVVLNEGEGFLKFILNRLTAVATTDELPPAKVDVLLNCCLVNNN